MPNDSIDPLFNGSMNLLSDSEAITVVAAVMVHGPEIDDDIQSIAEDIVKRLRAAGYRIVRNDDT